MWVMGENPAMSDPDVDHARQALATLDHLVVQDIFLTETAYLADVVLPATAWPEKNGTVTNTDRIVQLGRKAIEPPGDARPDLWIINELARGMGLDWHYSHPRLVFDEMRQCMDSIAGITWDRLERESSVTYPCEKEGDPGQPVVFVNAFPDAERSRQVRPGRSHLGGGTARRGVPDGAHHRTPARTLAHRLDDPARLGARQHRAGAGRLRPPARSRTARRHAGRDARRIESRRGAISLYARADDGMPRGAVFVPFCYYEAAANKLTNPVLDPFGKIPEFKYCAIRVSKGGPTPVHSSFGGGTLLTLSLVAAS